MSFNSFVYNYDDFAILFWNIHLLYLDLAS